MKKSVFYMFAVAVLALAVAFSPSDDSPYSKYIDKYSALAVSEMYRTGVPASITLAQGILESGVGRSALATEGNNHFGIKCHGWKGRSMKADDDRKAECFRAYGSAEESFRDHSDFLRYQDRYKFLFDYETTDYKSWAYGLKKAGYATDPSYPSKLIKYIEDYDLSRYDRMSVKEAVAQAEKKGVEVHTKQKEEKVSSSAGKMSRKEARQARREKRRRRRMKAEEVVPEGEELIDESMTQIPEAPHAIEEARAIESGETFTFSLSRQVYERNGVPFIYSVDGETYASIAKANNLFNREILKINDLDSSEDLLPGTVVYLQTKKPQAAKGLEKYIVDHDGESLREISQRFGVRLESILAMNGFDKNHVTAEGETILLRGQTRKKRK